jgi:prepilin-type N-terminal cleavage/methylation domain-containing protein
MDCRELCTSQRGLSLVETMVALMVIAVGLAGVQRFFPQGLATGRHSLERTQATLLGKGKLEELRLQGFETLTAAHHPIASPEPFLDGQQQVTFPRFRWQAEVMRPAEDLVEVHLRVVWPWPQQTYQVEFATYVSQR